MVEDIRDLNQAQIPVVSVVGKSDVGKTTLLEKLLQESKRRGWRVATVKHDVHGFDMDKPGKDTWRHAQAGADMVVISSPNKIAILESVDEDKPLDEVLGRIRGVDLIFTEGYRRANKAKIEIYRSEVYQDLLCEPEELMAIAADVQLNNGVPCYDLDDAKGLCDLIAEKFELR